MTGGRVDATRAPFRPDIEGLRGLAVGLVLLFHAGLPFVEGGYVGVDVFFVISGFLITNHLMATLARDGRPRLLSFYANRARRILPAALVVIAASATAATWLVAPIFRERMLEDAVASALFVPNIAFAVHDTDYLAESTPSLFQHYWSLGVEEQFYLLWPLLVWGLWAVTGGRRVLLGCLLATVGAMSFVVCVWLTAENQPWAFFTAPVRAWEFALGAAVALAATRRRSWLDVRGVAPMTAAAGALAVVGSAVLFDDRTAFPGAAAALPSVGAALLIWAGSSGSSATRALAVRPLRALGLISYSAYLVHWPAVVLTSHVVEDGGELSVGWGLGAVAASLPVAWALHRWVERPWTRPGRRLTWPSRTVMTGLTAAAGVAVLASALLTVSQRDPVAVDVVVPEAAVSIPPRFTDVVSTAMTPSLREVDDDRPVIYDNGCHRSRTDPSTESCVYGDRDGATSVVLFGDSHAASWFPALDVEAREAGMALHVFTKSGCPSAEVTAYVGGGYPACTAWRAAVMERIDALEPEAVVVSNAYRRPSDDWSAAAWRQEWAAGVASTVRELAPAPVVVVADIPRLPVPPAGCLSGHLTDASRCGTTRADALDAAGIDAERRATLAAGGRQIDMNPYLCDARCDPIIGDTLVYRDEHHLTVEFATLISDVFWAELVAAARDSGRDGVAVSDDLSQ